MLVFEVIRIDSDANSELKTPLMRFDKKEDALKAARKYVSKGLRYDFGTPVRDKDGNPIVLKEIKRGTYHAKSEEKDHMVVVRAVENKPLTRKRKRSSGDKIYIFCEEIDYAPQTMIAGFEDETMAEEYAWEHVMKHNSEFVMRPMEVVRVSKTEYRTRGTSYTIREIRLNPTELETFI